MEAAPHILAPFDDDMVVLAEKELREHGIKLILGNGVKEFVSLDDKNQEVRLADGQAVTANLVVLAMGVRPDTEFLADSDIKLAVSFAGAGAESSCPQGFGTDCDSI